jgi:hypothetical protein
MENRMKEMRKQSIKGLSTLVDIGKTTINIAKNMNEEEWDENREKMFDARGLKQDMSIYVTREDFIEDMTWLVEELSKQVKLLKYQERQKNFYKSFKWKIRDLR